MSLYCLVTPYILSCYQQRNVLSVLMQLPFLLVHQFLSVRELIRLYLRAFLLSSRNPSNQHHSCPAPLPFLDETKRVQRLSDPQLTARSRCVNS